MELKQSMVDADLRFAVLSDAHITHRGEGIEKFTEDVMQLMRMTPKPQALVFSGDIAYQIDRAGGGVCDVIYNEPYDMINAVLRRYVDVPVVYAIGNHEYPQNRREEDITAEALQMFREKTGHELFEDKVIAGYHFITLGIDSWACHIPPEIEAKGRRAAEAAMAEDPAKPVFIIFHPPVEGTVVGTDGHHQSPEFEEWIKSQPRVMNIVGHLHTPANDPGTIWQQQGGFTTIHAPLCAVGNVCVNGCVNRDLWSGPVSQGLYFEVKGTKILIHKLEFMTGKELDEPWELDVAELLRGEGYYYTDARKELSNAPVFPPKTELLCEDAGEGRITVDFCRASCRSAGKNQDGFTKFYRFDLIPANSLAVCKSITYATDYYLPNPAERFHATLNTGLPAGKYTLRVTPVGPFGKEGEPLEEKLKLK